MIYAIRVSSNARESARPEARGLGGFPRVPECDTRDQGVPGSLASGCIWDPDLPWVFISVDSDMIPEQRGWSYIVIGSTSCFSNDIKLIK